MALGLAAFTLAGFAAVSSFISGRGPQSVPADPGAKSAPAATREAVQPAAGRPNLAEAQFRSDLGRAQMLLDQLNDAIAAADWIAAQREFAEFEQHTLRLPAPQLDHPDISPVMQDFFALYKVQLSRALTEQNPRQSRFAANQLFGIVSEQRARLGSRGIPIEFQRIGFLIREIDLWKQAGDTEMLRLRAGALQEAWKEVRPVIAARRNGADGARQFDVLVEKLAGLDPAQDAAALLSDFNKEFEAMRDMLFQRPARPQGAPSGGVKSAEDDD